MKKKIKGILMFFIFFSAIFSFSHVTRADVNNKIEVKTAIGFNNNYKIGYYTPITLTIDNKYKDIQGEIEIRVPSSAGKYVSYIKKLSMQKDSQKVVTIDVPINGTNVKYKLLINNGKQNIYINDININNTSNNITKFIGILSEDIDSLSYIDSVPTAQGGSLVTKPIMLDEKTFPEDILTLANFDILVINNFDTTKLNKNQYEMLKQWVKNGGTLLVGTGRNYTKSLGIFKDDFIKGKIGEISTISTSQINSIATNGDNTNKINLEILNIELQNANSNITDNAAKLLQSFQFGKGKVGIAAFDFGQSPFTNWSNNTVFIGKVFQIINPSLVDINKINNTNVNQNIWMLKDAMNQFVEMGSTKTFSFYIILFIYIVVVAPLSYIVLKKLDKRELMWVTVPTFAVIFGFIVFLSGAGGRINKVTTNVISTIYMDSEGNTSGTSYAGIFTPKKMELKVESKSDNKLFNVSDSTNIDPNAMMSTENSDLEAKVYSEENGSIEYYNTSILDTKLIQIYRDNLNLGKLESAVKISNNSLTGSIKNSTKLDLEDCYLITPSEYYKIGDIKSGESKAVGSAGSSVNYQGNIDQFANMVLMNNNFYSSNMSQADKLKYMDNNQKASILRMTYMSSNMMINDIHFIGFTKTPICSALTVNGKAADKNERSIVDMCISLNYREGNTFNYPMGLVPYSVLNSSNLNYDPYNKRFNGNGSAELQYSLDKTMKVEEVSIGNLTSFKGNQATICFYNFLNNTYENIQDQTIKGDNIKKYIDKDNNLKLKLELNNGDCEIPKAAAKGTVK